MMIYEKPKIEVYDLPSDQDVITYSPSDPDPDKPYKGESFD